MGGAVPRMCAGRSGLRPYETVGACAPRLIENEEGHAEFALDSSRRLPQAGWLGACRGARCTVAGLLRTARARADSLLPRTAVRSALRGPQVSARAGMGRASAAQERFVSPGRGHLEGCNRRRRDSRAVALDHAELLESGDRVPDEVSRAVRREMDSRFFKLSSV